MEILSEVLVLMSGWFFIGLLGFVVTLFIGRNKGNKTAQMTGKYGSLICLALSVSLISLGLIANESVEEEAARQEEMNKAFTKSSKQFTKFAKSADSYASIVADLEHREWGNVIDGSGNFDVDETVSDIVFNNSGLIGIVNRNLKDMKKQLNIMEKNDTNKFDYKAHKELYKKTKKMYNFISSPYGSYLNFPSNFRIFEDDFDDAYSNLTK